MTKKLFWSFVIILIITTNIDAEQFEKITRCAYRKDGDIESFEFVCESNKHIKDFFSDGDPIDCNDFTNYYKERRHEIYFKNCNLKQLPVIFKWYKKVRKLDVSYTNLQTIRSRNFDYGENLIKLIASHNQLVEIPALLFVDSKNIRNVDFSYNNISKIDATAFDADNQLTHLIFANNLIVTIDNRTFYRLNQLNTLNLNNNLIEHIDEGTFDGLNNLMNLYLDNNRLKSVECELFEDLFSLEQLRLNQNHLHELNMSCIPNMESLALSIGKNHLNNLTISRNVSEIHAQENKLKWIYFDVNEIHVSHLDVWGNDIQNIIDVIKHLGSNLMHLDVSDNLIGALNISTFARFNNLKTLKLRNTSISNIQYGTFHHQKDLEYFDISNNHLKKIDFDILHWDLENVQEIILSGNQLSDLSGLTKDKFPNLKFISIADNNFNCSYLSKMKTLWKSDGILINASTNANLSMNHDQTHIDGIHCNHSLASDKSKNNPELQTDTKINEQKNKNANTDNSKMPIIEYILIGIVIVLICLLIAFVVKQNQRFLPYSHSQPIVFHRDSDEF